MHREHLESCSVPKARHEAQLQRWDVGPTPKRQDSPAQSAKRSSSLARSQAARGTMPCT